MEAYESPWAVQQSATNLAAWSHRNILSSSSGGRKSGIKELAGPCSPRSL